MKPVTLIRLGLVAIVVLLYVLFSLVYEGKVKNEDVNTSLHITKVEVVTATEVNVSTIVVDDNVSTIYTDDGYDWEEFPLVEYPGVTQLRKVSPLLWIAYDESVDSNDVAFEYYANKGIRLPTADKMLTSNVFSPKNILNIEKFDVIVFSYDSILYKGLYIGNGFMLTNRGNDTINIDTVTDYYIISILGVYEDINLNKFMKMTAIVETGNRDIDRPMYFGRYQIAKRYVKYYTDKIGIAYKSGKPSEYVQRKIVKAILDDSIKYLRKKKLPVTMYNVRMVYMLGRGNYTKMLKGKLPKSIIASNIPKTIKPTIANLHKYWCSKVSKVLKIC